MGYSLLTNLSGKTLHPNFLLVKNGLAVLVRVCDSHSARHKMFHSFTVGESMAMAWVVVA